MAQGSAAPQRALLMKHAEGFGLSSVSPGCLQVEAYLRLAEISFATMVMKTAGASPTGEMHIHMVVQLPSAPSQLAKQRSQACAQDWWPTQQSSSTSV